MADDSASTCRAADVSPELVVDHEARETAKLAKQQIDKHEEHCGERWTQARGAMDGLREDIKDLHHRINSLVRAAILLIATVCGFAVVQWLLAKGVAG